MLAEQSNSSNNGSGIGPVEAYRIIQNRQISEDRIIVERTSIFLAANSILFLAFVMLLSRTSVWFLDILGIILALSGISVTCLIYVLNLVSANALDFWHGAERVIEETTPEFSYLLENEITPHLHADEAIQAGKRWRKNEKGKLELQAARGIRKLLSEPLSRIELHKTYWFYLPLVFFTLWLAALAVAITRLVLHP